MSGFVAYIGINTNGKHDFVPPGSKNSYNFPAPRLDNETGARIPVFIEIKDETDYKYFVWKAPRNPKDWIAKARVGKKDGVEYGDLQRARKIIDDDDPNQQADIEKRKQAEAFEKLKEYARLSRIALCDPEKKKELEAILKGGAE